MSVTEFGQESSRRPADEIVAQLRQCLGFEFSVFNTSDGRLVHESGEQPNGDPAWRKQLARDWTNHDQVHLKFVGGPLALLLIPLAKLGYDNAAVLGLFRLTESETDGQIEDVQLWQTAGELEDWLSKQPVWTRESLKRVAGFALEKLVADRRMEQLNREVQGLATRIGESFEQISLLYGMTENLRGSSNAAELASFVLDWLVDILPAEQAIIEIHNGNKSSQVCNTSFEAFGKNLLDETSFRRLIENLKPGNSDKPLVLNEASTGGADWPFPTIRELIVVPLRTDNRNTGWLAALNHAAGGWFGTTQARLLHAAATILGMRVLFEEVAELRKTSETASASKSVFLTNVSHEFRTPLNGIMSFTRMLLDESDGEGAPQHDSLRTIDHCAKRLFELVEDVVEFSRLEAGDIEVERVPFRLDELLLGVVSDLEGRAHAKNLRLEVNGARCGREIILSDPARLRQVLTVLVRNAIKFTETGLIQVISQVFESDKRRLRIFVRDTGIGIAPEKLETIFDPFVQADGSITRSYGGLGLGLAISKRIALSLGGDLSAASEPGRGSIFTLEVDAGPADMDLDEDSISRRAIMGRSPLRRPQPA